MTRVRRGKIMLGHRLRIKATDDVVRRLFGRCVEVMSPHSPDGCPCWVWQGWTDENGYGRISICNRNQWVHRASYAMMKRTIPAGMDVDHECHNPGCVFPGHLVQKSKSGNSREGALWRVRKSTKNRRRQRSLGSAAAAVAAQMACGVPF